MDSDALGKTRFRGDKEMNKEHCWKWNAMDEAWRCKGTGTAGKAFRWGRKVGDYCSLTGCAAVVTLEQYWNHYSCVSTYEQELFGRLNQIERLRERENEN